MTSLHEQAKASVPPLSAEQVRILQSWCESEADVERAWIYGSRIRGWRRDPSKITPSDIDLAVAFAQDSEAQHDRDASRGPLVRLKASLKAYLASHPNLFGSNPEEANFVELRIAFEGSQVMAFIDYEPTTARPLFNRRLPICWPQEP